MHPFPHRYGVTLSLPADGDVSVESEGLPSLATAPPVEFGGPGGRWSPETLLVAAVADCFALSFRAVARASKLEWVALRCECEGTLDRVDRVTRFTEMAVHAHLTVPAGVDADRAQRVLEKAKATCLVTQSLTAETRLETKIETGT